MVPDHSPSTDERASLAQPSQSSSPLECTSHLGFSLVTIPEEREARIAEREARIAAESRADAAEARTRQLEEELRRLRGQ